MLAGYGHLLRAAEAARWDDAGIDLSADALAWPTLGAEARERLLHLLAGFCLGEARVAEELEPFVRASGGEAAACFHAQARDEQRHARFFDRVAAEVARVPGSAPEERRAWLSARLAEPFVALFEVELRAATGRLAREPSALAAGVGLYHLLLEGVVFAAGQAAMLDQLRRLGTLPGLTLGMERVMRDERWHIGLGARCILDTGADAADAERLLAEGERCARAWGEAVPATRVAESLRLHRRRLRAAGLTGEPVAG